MRQPNRFTARQAPADRWTPWAPPALVAGASLATLAGGITCLLIYSGGRSSGPLLAPSGIVLIACAALQIRFLAVAWRRGWLLADTGRIGCRIFWLRLVLGAWVLYLAALLVGPLPQMGWAWLASTAIWQTLLMLPLAASPKVVENWRRWTQERTPWRLSWLVCASILLVVLAEGGLRAYRSAHEGGWLQVGVPRVEDLANAATAPDDMPFDLPIARLKGGRFRVAILGDAAPCDRGSGGYLALVQQSLPGVEIVPLAASLARPHATAGDVAAHVDECNPDLVLAILPVCEELSRQLPSRDYFDWRQFELARLLVGPPPVERATAKAAADDYESYLRELAPQLAACRTPIDDAMRDRWKRAFAALDEIIAGCRTADVPLALVIAPGEMQVNGTLREALLRRHGFAAERFDAELPQRCLRGFADERRVPLVDLLPHLRRSEHTVYRRHAAELNEHGNAVAANAVGGWLQSCYGGQWAAQLSKAP